MSEIKLKNQPNIDNIHVGDVISNYKKLCEVLELKEADGGRNRKAQLNEISRYFDWEKSGNKFLITEVYPEPIPKKLFNRETKYANDLSNNLLCYFKIRNVEEILILKNELMLATGMCNQHYIERSLGLDFDYKFPTEKVKNYNLNEFYKMSNTKLTKILNYSLDSLHKHFLLKWEQVYVKGYKDSYGNEISNMASIDEEKIIGDIIYNKLKEFGFNTEYEAVFKNKGKQFYKEVSELVCSQLGCDYYYRAYHIILYNINSVNYEIQDRINKNEINSKIVDELIRVVEYKEQHKDDWGEHNATKYFDENFYSTQKKLVNYLISIKSKI